jgi:hypothetical protein
MQLGSSDGEHVLAAAGFAHFFVFHFFVFSYNMLQRAHPDQWAMKYTIYMYNFVMANSITFRIDCCHPSRNKKGLLFFS